MNLKKIFLAAIPENLISKICQTIYEFEEVMFEEVRSADYLTAILEEEGFEVKRGIAGLPTAFVARYQIGEGGPSLGLMAEYDALAGLGHACGHNLIAGAALGAAIALKNIAHYLSGSILVFGTPAEEGGGGKVVISQAGYFDDVDAVVYFHPSVRDDRYGSTLACRIYELIFNGKPAHVQLNPHEGRNALKGLIKVFEGVKALEARFKDDIKIGGIIKDGGYNSILVPQSAEGEFLLSAINDNILEQLHHSFMEVVHKAAAVTETEAEIKEIMHYSSVVQNQRLNEVIAKEMLFLGLKPAPPTLLMTSTDCGSTSKRCPFAGFRLSMGNPSPTPHTTQFAKVAGSSEGIAKAVMAARISGLALLELFTTPKLLREIKDEFLVNSSDN